jgi:hypothetical protein
MQPPSSLLNLVVNRFSGALSSALINKPPKPMSFSILSGNAFDCANKKTGLPQFDPNIQNVQCGSDKMNSFLYVLLTLLCVVGAWRIVKGRQLQGGAEKADAVRALGADRVVGRDADLAALFGAEPFDAAVDVVGGPQFGAILAVLKRGGRYGVSGAISGPVVDLDLRTLYLKDLRLIGCTVLEPEVFPTLVGIIERGEIRPSIAAIYPLAEIVAAQESFLTKRHVGKIVLTI